MISKLALFIVVLQSTGAILTRFGLVLHTSLYSCNFLCERRIEIKFLPISSTILRLKSISTLEEFSVCPVKFVYRSGAISTAENLLSSATLHLLVVA